jgi:hypothetical protein
MKISSAVSISCFACLALEAFGVPSARADDCELATAAAIAQAKVPYATTHVTTVEGEAPARAEMVFYSRQGLFACQGRLALDGLFAEVVFPGSPLSATIRVDGWGAGWGRRWGTKLES